MLGAASYLVLSPDFVGGVAHAQTAGNLPAVTVDAPKPAVRRAATRSRATAAGPVRRRAAAPAPHQVEPVRFLSPSTAALGAPPAPYAGGQVATGGSLGLLGNRGVMDTPFNQTNYTAQLIQNQQARTIRDVLINDPSVRVIQAAGGGADGLFIRGFYYDSGDYGLNGLYGIAPYYSTQANFVDRVEVLKGPSALLNGMTAGGTGVASGGAVGGSVNLVTKHAPDFDITQLTATYASKSQFGLQTDIARRYGENKEWGVRFNGGYSNGKTPWNQTDEFGNAVLGLDYRGERVRVSADVGYQSDNLTRPMRFLTISPTTVFAIPPAPKAGSNFEPDWAYYRPTDTFTTVRGEVDVTDWATVYGAFGYHDSKIDYSMVSPTLTNRNATLTQFQLGGLRGTPFLGHETFETFAGEAGVRASVDTGPINHALNVNYSENDRTYTQVVRTAPAVSWNLYSTPSSISPVYGAIPQVNQATDVSLSSIGVSDTMSMFNKRLQVTVGVRRQTAGTEVTSYLSTGSRPQADSSVWSPAYAVLIKPVENISLYANYIEGLQSAIVVGSGFANVGTIFAPYQTKQAEAGVKVDLGRFTTTLSVFDITKPNVITLAASNTQQLDGEQRNRGVELNVFGEIIPSIRLLGGLAWIDGRQTKTQGGLNDGKWAIGVPTLNVNLGAEWDVPFIRDLTLTGAVIYTAQQYANEINTLQLPSWTRVDIGARYAFDSPWNGKPIVVRAKVENLLNEAYWASAYSGVITLGAPRTYLVSTTFNF